MRGAPRDEEWLGRVQIATQADFNERAMKTIGAGRFRYGFKLHAGVYGQLIAKTCHAFAVAHLGVDGFEPFLTDYIMATQPRFDSYHLASTTFPPQTEFLHEISLQSIFVPAVSIVGVGSREVYAVRWRMFGQLSGPVFTAIVGKPVNRAQPAL